MSLGKRAEFERVRPPSPGSTPRLLVGSTKGSPGLAFHSLARVMNDGLSAELMADLEQQEAGARQPSPARRLPRARGRRQSAPFARNLEIEAATRASA